MTPDIPALREALAAATQGPWHVSQFTECSDTLGRGTGPLQAIQRSHIPGKQTFAQILEAKASIEDMALIALAVNALPGLLARLEKAEDIASFAECRRVCATDMTPCFRLYRGREDLWCDVCEYRAERAKMEAPDGR